MFDILSSCEGSHLMDNEEGFLPFSTETQEYLHFAYDLNYSVWFIFISASGVCFSWRMLKNRPIEYVLSNKYLSQIWDLYW